MIQDTNLNNPVLLKRGVEFPLKVISSSTFEGTQTFKNVIKKLFGDENNFEYIGVGDRKIKIPVYLESQEEFEKLIDFFSDGKPFILHCSFFPLIPVNLEGNITLKPYFKGCGMAEINLTTATNPRQNVNGLLNLTPQLISSGNGSKKSVLDKLNNFAKNRFNFTSNTNQKIGVLTNVIAAYAAAINNSSQGIASSSTIVTNPISSIKSSASQVIGGISGIVNSLQNAVNAVRKVPSDVTSLVESSSLIGDQINSIFDLGDNNSTLKYNCFLLLSISNSIIKADVSQDNLVISNFNSTTSSAEFFLTSVDNINKQIIDILLLISMLMSVYENMENINKWNSNDLDNIRDQAEFIYFYIITFEISSDLKLELDLSRNNFLLFFKELYKNSLKIIEVFVPETKMLSDVVYSVNGNFDNMEETKKLNNIIGMAVKGNILVIRNE